MAMCAQRVRISVAVDAGDRLLARRINRRHDCGIGIVEAGGELLEGITQACKAMRLDDGNNRPGKGLPRSLQCSCDLERIMRVVINDGRAVPFADPCEAPVDAGKAPQGFAYSTSIDPQFR